MDEMLKIGKREFTSRLIVGTGKYPSMDAMQAAHAASGAQMITVAIRRINLDEATGKTLLDYIDRSRYTILPTRCSPRNLRASFSKPNSSSWK